MATKRLIDAMVNSVEAKVDAEKLLERESSKVYTCSHAELAKWMGERGKKAVKGMAATLAGSKRISSVMPTLRRQFEVGFNISTKNPDSRFVQLGAFDYSRRPGDLLVEGVFSEKPGCYEDRVVLHGYRVVRGYSDLPAMNTTLQWNLDDMVKGTIETLNNTRDFLDKSIRRQPYAELADRPDTNRVLSFVKTGKEEILNQDKLVPHPRTIFSHRISKCIAALSQSTVRNGVAYVMLSDPAKLGSEPVNCAVMHATHIMVLFMLANDTEFKLHFTHVPDALKNESDRCLVVLPEEVFERFVPQLLERFENKAPTFDPNRMCFSVSCLHRPDQFEQRVFAPEEPEEFHFESRWLLEMEYSLVPRQILGHAPLFAEEYNRLGVQNTEQLTRYLKASETARLNEISAAQLKEDFARSDAEYQANLKKAAEEKTDAMVE